MRELLRRLEESGERVACDLQEARVEDDLRELVDGIVEKSGLDHEINTFLHGVIVGAAPGLDRHTKKMYTAFKPVRAYLKKKYGGKLKLWRGAEVSVRKPVERQWLSWTNNARMAATFAVPHGSEKRKVYSAVVPVSDVVAVLLSPHNDNYIEFLVRNKPKYKGPGEDLPQEGAVWDVPTEKIKALVKAVKKLGGRVLKRQRGEYGDENDTWIMPVILPAGVSEIPGFDLCGDAGLRACPRAFGTLGAVAEDGAVSGVLNRLEERKGSLERPHTCKTKGCDKAATKAVIWADGRAFVSTCDEHLAATKKSLSVAVMGKFGGVTAVKPLPQKNGVTEAVDASGLEVEVLKVLDAVDEQEHRLRHSHAAVPPTTVARINGMLDDYDASEEFYSAGRAARQKMVRSALMRLKRKGAVVVERSVNITGKQKKIPVASWRLK